MRRGRTLSIAALIVLAFSALIADSRKFTIPSDADVRVVNAGRDSSDPASSTCKDYRLTPRQVRRKFAKVHTLEPGELHDSYITAPCWVRGTITLNGNTYRWEIRPGDTIRTDYPDHNDKMLGAAPTEDLSEGERKKQH
ncbi:MAG: hypothetical protein M3Y57_03195 [Acidobacteriota bacterium]|nr:hypothetical protein [Acidobacteriota bacterium]